MSSENTSKVGKRGTVVIPAKLRKRFGIEEGSYIMAEEREDGILIRPAVVSPVEMYSPERVAKFLLSNSVDAADYARNLEEVRRLGLDPGKIDHVAPPGA
jgi:AbrB family looped-hinge helix DNA binding protein